MDHVIHRFRKTAQLHAGRIATRIYEAGAWQQQTYEQFLRRINSLAQGLLDFGIEVGDRVGLFASNCPQWSEIDFGVGTIRGVLVPLYATSTPEQVAHIISDSGMKMMIVDGKSEADRVLAAAEFTTVPTVLAMNDYEGRPDEVHLVDDLYRQPTEAIEERVAEAEPDDLSALVYTSGTTGLPKGVMITHRALVAQSDGLEQFFSFAETESSLCFLPLCHALERGWTIVVLLHGCMNTYVRDPKTVAQQLVLAQPTMLVSVPKLYEKVFTTVHQKAASSPIKKAIFSWALRVGRHNQYAHRAGREPNLLLRLQRRIADRLVFKAVRDAMGGAKHVMACGGAPLRIEVEEFFSSVGLPIRPGYGLTEAGPLVTFNAPSAFKLGTAGVVMPGGELRIGELGEILYRGPNVMKGYWNHPEATAEAVDEDGWLHTGDVGYIDRDGFLSITDRLKDIIVTLGGKNVSPQPVEGLILSDPLFEHAVLIGDTRPFVTLLVKPSEAVVEELAKTLQWPGELTDWLRSTELMTELRARVKQLTAHLPIQDQPKETELLDGEVSMENGLLTPTLKIRRREVEKRFKSRIDLMYERLESLRRAGKEES